MKSVERQVFKHQQAERDFLSEQVEKEEKDRPAPIPESWANSTATPVIVKGCDVRLEGSLGGRGFGRTFKQILDTGLVQNVLPTSAKHGVGRKRKTPAKIEGDGEVAFSSESGASLQQNGNPVRERVTSLKHVKLKRLTHMVDGQVVFRKPVGRPRKNTQFSGASGDFVNGESLSGSCGPRPSAKYRSAAQQLLARATKLHHTSSASVSSSTPCKVRKFVLPTKSSRSSRVIKPNKRFLEEDNAVHAAIVASSGAGGKQARLTESGTEHIKLELPSTISNMVYPSTCLPSSSGDAPLKKSIFDMDVGDAKPGSLGGSLSSSASSAFPSSPFLHHPSGSLVSRSPFNLTREKGFPAFSAAPQPSGTSSFTDQSIHCHSPTSAGGKPLGALDQPLIVEGKRPRKPSLIMRMKLVEDDPDDEIRLQQSLLADSTSPQKPPGYSPSSSISPSVASSADLKVPDNRTDLSLTTQSAPATSLSSPPVHGYGTTKSLIAPAKLFTNSSSSSAILKLSKSRRHRLKSGLLPAQQTVVLRQAKLQLNRAALNRSKAALARSLKATLKREARLERKKKISLRKMRKCGSVEVIPPPEGSDVSAASGLLALSNSTSIPALSPSASAKLSQLSPFSLQTSGAMVERSKQGLFQGMEGSHKADVKEEPPGMFFLMIQHFGII